MRRMSVLLLALAFIMPAVVWAVDGQDYLVKLKGQSEESKNVLYHFEKMGAKVTPLGIGNWVRVEIPNHANKRINIGSLKSNPQVMHVQKNKIISLMEDYRIKDPGMRKVIAALKEQEDLREDSPFRAAEDNPPIPDMVAHEAGDDPKFSEQWGMNDIGAKEAWEKTTGSEEMIVAVLDTGVDYTHEDLLPNLWRNPGETGEDENGNDKATNGIDDDNNGYVDDVVGYDFVSKDSKPYDLTLSLLEVVMSGGNPGHGTHCAGNVAAKGNNSKGIAGVAPDVKIMSLRFISEKGQGTTADAILAIKYAVDNGARVLSNSWGGEGKDDDADEENVALKEAVQYVAEHDGLFIVAAGNGRNGKGYNNDTDSKPVYPSSYDFDHIISVAALDSNDALGAFSNFGKKTVDIGAPGVKVFSTVPGNKYSDTILNFLITVTWDGTSMACPHVAGAAALYWSLDPEMSYKDVRDAVLGSAKEIPALRGKVSTDGKLDVKGLILGN